jgi:hypothetical protein
MATGSLPFKAQKAFDVLLMHVNDPLPGPRELVSDIPEMVEQVILQALAKSPEERYPRMQDMVAGLEAARDALQAPLHLASPRGDDTLHHATVQFDSIQSSLRGPRLIVVATGSLLLIPDQDEVLIGRADPRGAAVPDIDLSHYGGGSAGVSRRHARLLRRGDGWAVEDLGSTNGTYVNDQVLPPSQPQLLNDGDSVRCGQLALDFHSDEADPI